MAVKEKVKAEESKDTSANSERKKALEIAKEYFNTILWPPKLKQILNKAEN